MSFLNLSKMQKDHGVADYMLEIYNIIGDPALMLR